MLESLARLIAPPYCLGCSRQGSLLCESCRNLPTTKSTCLRCEKYSSDGRTCALCKPNCAVDGLTFTGRYGGLIKDLVLRMKYRHARAAAEPLAVMMAGALPSWLTFNTLTVVPTAWGRRRARGFDHAALLARRVAQRLDLPFYQLLARASTTRQVGSNRQKRLMQAKNAYFVTQQIANQHILLIDDVTTTGATLTSCAAELKSAGAATVWCLVAARD
jgi:ComF family protein